MQEYLAAYHIIFLQEKEELMMLGRLLYQRDTLENEELIAPHQLYYRKEITHLNIIQMYIGLTKGQRSAFKKLLEDHQVKYHLSHTLFTGFLLHRTLYEANDIRSCNMINECFADRRIIHCLKPPIEVHAKRQMSYIERAYQQQSCVSLYRKHYNSYSALLPNDVENLTHFLAHQTPGKCWEELCLDSSYIGNHGCQILHHGLIPHVALNIEAIDIQKFTDITIS